MGNVESSGSEASFTTAESSGFEDSAASSPKQNKGENLADKSTDHLSDVLMDDESSSQKNGNRQDPINAISPEVPDLGKQNGPQRSCSKSPSIYDKDGPSVEPSTSGSQSSVQEGKADTVSDPIATDVSADDKQNLDTPISDKTSGVTMDSCQQSRDNSTPAQPELNGRVPAHDFTLKDKLAIENIYIHEPTKEVFKREFDKLPSDPFKIVVLGNIGAGKTSIIRRYVMRRYSPEYQATIGLDLAVKEVKLNQTSVKLHIWDMAGEERSKHVTRALFREVHGAVVVYDVTSHDVCDQLKCWKNIVDHYVAEPDGTEVPIILMSNKVDLLPGWYMLHSKLEEELFCELGFNYCFQTSAKENLNIDVAFFRLLQMMAENRMKNFRLKKERARGKISLSNKTSSTNKCAC